MDPEYICPMCQTPQPPRDCLHCPAYRLTIKELKENNIDFLQKEVWRLEEVEYEIDFLRSECEHYKKLFKRVQKEHHDLEKDLSHQKQVIKKMQKEKIEAIGKVLITFMYNQSDG